MALEGYGDNNATTYKGNDIDNDGDGTVDTADSALTYKGNDIDSDGDGTVDAADDAATLNGNTVSQVQNHTPQAHAASHANGGSDALSGTLNVSITGDADTVDGQHASDLQTTTIDRQELNGGNTASYGSYSTIGTVTIPSGNAVIGCYVLQQGFTAGNARLVANYNNGSSRQIVATGESGDDREVGLGNRAIQEQAERGLITSIDLQAKENNNTGNNVSGYCEISSSDGIAYTDTAP